MRTKCGLSSKTRSQVSSSWDSALSSLIVATAVLGCGGEPSEANPLLPVHSVSPEWDSGEGWRVDPRPILVAPEGSASEGFLQRASDAVLLEDGTIVVADSGRDQILVFDSDGDLKNTLGRKGEGPGEFEALSRVVILGDTLVTVETGGRRITWLAADGEVLRTERPGQFAPSNTEAWVVSPALTIVALQTERGSLDAPSGLDRPGRFVVSPRSDGSLDTIAELPGPERIFLELGYPLPYPVRTMMGPTAHIAGGGSPWRVALGDGATPRIEVFDENLEGQLEFSWDMDRPQISPNNRGLLREYWTESRVSDGGMDRAEALRRTNMLPDPDHLPIFDDLVVDQNGSIWARTTSEPWTTQPHRWLVFGPDGGWLGDVEVPRSISHILRITGDRIVGVSTDALGVEQIVVHALYR